MDNIPSREYIRGNLSRNSVKGRMYTFEQLKPYLKNTKRMTNLKDAFTYLDMNDSRLTSKELKSDGFIDSEAFAIDAGRIDLEFFRASDSESGSRFNLISNEHYAMLGNKLFGLNYNISDLNDILIAIAMYNDKIDKDELNRKDAIKSEVRAAFGDYELPNYVFDDILPTTKIETIDTNGKKSIKLTTDIIDETHEYTVTSDKVIKKIIYNNENSDISEYIEIKNNSGKYNDNISFSTTYKNGVSDTNDFENDRRVIKQGSNSGIYNDAYGDIISKGTINDGNEMLYAEFCPIFKSIEDEGETPNKIQNIKFTNKSGLPITFKEKSKMIELLNNNKLYPADFQLKVEIKDNIQNIILIEKET